MMHACRNATNRSVSPFFAAANILTGTDTLSLVGADPLLAPLLDRTSVPGSQRQAAFFFLGLR
jgi:hypothetical protein